MAGKGSSAVKGHPVVSRAVWLAARKALLAKEKALTRRRDELNRERRELPWVKVEKDYVFDGPNGKATLADLFGDRNQLVVYHFMFGPEWKEGCKHCSFWADHYDAAGIHLNHRDVSFAAVSRAPLAKIEGFKKRMGWRFTWVSSFHNDFNFDFLVSFTPEEVENGTAIYNYSKDGPGMTEREGTSVFYKDARGRIFHTYSTYARGIDMLNGTYHFLDLVPKGRDEDPEDPQGWVRHHDRYEG
jgi:predicted dithiol-disulfide oxidoreductase (DUF899 family)